MQLNLLAKRVHEANKKWWTNLETGAPIERNRGEMLMLVITELSEAVEGERKDLMDDKLPHRKMAEVEMADAYIRLLDYAAGWGFSIDESGAHISLPDNKAEALLEITKMVTRILDYGHAWITPCLAMIRAYCNKHGYDLMGAFEDKMAYNAVREDHKIEARKLAGGKKF